VGLVDIDRLDDDELEALRHAACWEPHLDLPLLTDAERDVVHQRIDGLAAERETRSDAHRDRLRSTAGWLGREVASHRVLLADAQDRLERLARTADADSLVPMFLVPYREAIDLIVAAFAAQWK